MIEMIFAQNFVNMFVKKKKKVNKLKKCEMVLNDKLIK